MGGTRPDGFVMWRRREGMRSGDFEKFARILAGMPVDDEPASAGSNSLADLAFAQSVNGHFALRNNPFSYKVVDDAPGSLEEAGLEIRGGIRPIPELLGEVLIGPSGSTHWIPTLRLFPVGDEPVPDFDLGLDGDSLRSTYAGRFHLAGTWDPALGDDGFEQLDEACMASPGFAAAGALGVLPPATDDECPPGSIRDLQPNEGFDSTRWLAHFGAGRSYDLGVGDGLDQAVADPEAHLARWDGEPIGRDDLVVARFGDCSYSGISLGDGDVAGLVDGSLGSFRLEPEDAKRDDLDVWHGPYPFSPFAELEMAGAMVDDAARRIGCSPLVALAGGGAALLLVLLLAFALGVFDDDDDDEPAIAVATPGQLDPVPDDESDDPEAPDDSEAATEIASGSDPADLFRVADGSDAAGADPLTEITDVALLDDGGTAVVEITVQGGDEPIDEARQDDDSSAYLVIVTLRDGTTRQFIWEQHLGELKDGDEVDQTGQTIEAGAADVTFTEQTVRFDLPDDIDPTDIESIEVRSFSHEQIDPDESGPEFVDQAIVSN